MLSWGIKTQVTLLSLGLLAIPLIGYTYWQQVREATLISQAQIQEVEAKAITTSLLATQQNIRDLLAGNINSELYRHSLAAPFMYSTIKLDGNLNDWPTNVIESSLSHYQDPIWQARDNLESKFSLLLAQSEQYLYLGIEVQDSLISYRRNHLRLDYNDQIRLRYLDSQGEQKYISIPAEQEGALASYYTNNEWEYGIDLQDGTPSHQTNIQGFWKRTEAGYIVEFRLPIAQLDTRHAQLLVTVVDVDQQPSLGPSAILSTLPKDLSGQMNPIELHARELQRVIDQLKTSYARLGIYDRSGREWAFASREATHQTFDLESACIQGALRGTPTQSSDFEYQRSNDGRITVCYPIIEQDETIGAVVIDEQANHVLKVHEKRLQDIAVKTGLTIAFIIGMMFIFAIVLAKRITRLNDAARQSVDGQGRILSTHIAASATSNDEIGELSRTISHLLEQQKSYVDFLERMPQTLRHEISNPLNKLKTSLENLTDQHPELRHNSYIKKLDAGVEQINNITQQLTEAASLESALKNEALKKINLTEFLNYYGSSWDGLQLSLPTESIWIMAEPSRLEQCFDKLLDNAYSFCTKEGFVSLRLRQVNHSAVIEVENDGPTIPEERLSQLFAPMVSTRSHGSDVHLGLGLHIAKIIADHHQARLTFANRKDDSGVVFSLAFLTV